MLAKPTMSRQAWKEAARALDAKLAGRKPELQPILARNPPRQPLHPAARIRQSQSRWFSTGRTVSTNLRHFTSSAQTVTPGVKINRAALPKSNVGNAVNRQSGRAPFASTLRPNLTGGTLGRTAGGYSLGGGRVGGARYFSHSPASQAQVVQNVSQAVRAFFISGHKAQFNGVNPVTGEKQYKAVTTLQEETGRKVKSLPKATPGSYIDFTVNPTITALTSLNSVAGYNVANSTYESEHLNTEGLLDVLSVDFSRALKDLAAVLNDLKRLSALGDLPITYQASSLRVHFPGCDAKTVEGLCDELNVQRGVVVQDEDFDTFVGTEIALLFPFAPISSTPSEADAYHGRVHQCGQQKHSPIDWRNMLTPSHSELAPCSTQSEGGCEDFELYSDEGNPWISSPSSLRYSSSGEQVAGQHDPLEYQGFEGIYRFIEQCDSAARR